MTEREQAPSPADDVDAVTQAVLTASRLLVASRHARSRPPRTASPFPSFRLLMVLSTHGPAKLVTLADRLRMNSSTAMRMMDRLIATGLADRQVNPNNRRETVLRVTEADARLVDEVTARRRAEIAAIVARMVLEQRSAMVDALTAFNQAGGEPAVADTEGVLHPLG